MRCPCLETLRTKLVLTFSPAAFGNLMYFTRLIDETAKKDHLYRNQRSEL